MVDLGFMDRKYPVGIQTFERIIKEGYVYVDKTDLVWKLTHYAKYIFLSRPRRFGKSLLTTTLHSYFEGNKELFEGLKIMELEKKWNSYPIIHIDLSVAKRQPSAEELRKTLMWILQPLYKIYGSDVLETSPGKMLNGLIHRVYEQTNEQVVVIIDEYDAPLLDILHEKEPLEEFRNVMQEFFIQLKANEALIKFCFITGITKFSQLSIFSTINNLTNVSMSPEFATICGITDEELTTVMAEDIRRLAEADECSSEAMHEKLKLRYDGYHFSGISKEVYNPFSLLKAFQQKELGNYWFESGTPTFLIRQMQQFRTDITAMDDIEVPSSAFDRPTEAMTNALPLLYQSGYLTIKDYDRESMLYHLSIPNQEVRIGFADGLLPTYIGLEGFEVQTGFALKFWRALKESDVNLALKEMQAYLAGLPYIEGFKKKLADVSNVEGFYEWTFYLIISMLNVYARTQVKCANGRIDTVVYMPNAIYVFEFKVNGSAKKALEQINDRGYAIQYQTDWRKVVKVGVNFSYETKTLKDWEIQK